MGKWLKRFKQDSDLFYGDEYKKLFDKCSITINEFWEGDCHRFMKKYCPDIARQINESEARIDQLWGNASLIEYQQELYRFYKLHEKVYYEYIQQMAS